MNNWFSTLKHQFRLRRKTSLFFFEINLVLVSSILLGLIHLLLFVITPKSESSFLEFHLIASLLMFGFFVFFLMLFLRKKATFSKWDRFIVKAFPLSIVLIGIAVSIFGTSSVSQIIPFIVAVIVCSIISYYRPLEALFFYSAALILYFLVITQVQTDVEEIYRIVRNGIIFTFLAIAYSLIAYKRHESELDAIEKNSDSEKKLTTLIENLEDANKKLTRSSQITKTIMDIMGEILTSESIESFLQLVLDKAIELTPKAQKGSVLLFKDGILEYKAAKGYDLAKLKNIKLKFEETFQYKLMDIYSPVIIKNLEVFNTEHVSEEKNEQFRRQNALIAKSILSCAFSLNGEYYGSMNLDNMEDEEAFKEEDITLIKHFITQIEVALANKELIDNILHVSRYDGLTQTMSRKYFEEQALKIHDSFVGENRTYSVCVIDTNDLKLINDQYGHMEGDRFLAYFMDTIRTHLDEPDLVGRTGGDEFTFIFPDRNKDMVIRLMQDIRDTFSQFPFESNGQQISTGFGFGVAEYPTDAKDYTALIRIADHAMYLEKEQFKKKM